MQPIRRPPSRGLRERIRPDSGGIAVSIYLAVLIRTASAGSIRPGALASSPAGVAGGHLVPLLSSGLVVEGPAPPQIAALALTLAIALGRLGPARTWRMALGAHVGATLLAYAALAVIAVVDQRLVASVWRAPDYGSRSSWPGSWGRLPGRCDQA